MSMKRRVAIYVRVSTDGQTTMNQQRELETVVKRHDWKVIDVFRDQGISGKNGRKQRPAFDRLLQGVIRKDFDIVAAWSVDRLGRSLQHLLSFLSELKAKGIDLLARLGALSRTIAVVSKATDLQAVHDAMRLPRSPTRSQALRTLSIDDRADGAEFFARVIAARSAAYPGP